MFRLFVLTKREKDVLALLARGKSNREIATSLGIREKTVRNTVSRIYVKLNVTRRTQAVLRAIELGLVTARSGQSLLTDEDEGEIAK
ncbi:MAG: hypothetical protein KatS3mg053_0447 [Candidatus Roseilinea sp.]|nr:MAG: hypothetical protein KatS3mg053_0447 [Candidatus Roseilinea sp.]